MTTEEFFETLKNEEKLVDKNKQVILTFQDLISKNDIESINEIITSDKLKDLHPSIIYSMIWMLKPSLFKRIFTTMNEVVIDISSLEKAYKESVETCR